MNGAITRYQTNAGETHWRVRWDLPPALDGSRRQRSKSGFATKKQAAAHLREVLGQQDRGVVSVRSTATVAEVCERWLDLKAAQGKRPTSLDNWSVSLRTHVIPRIGGLRVGDLTAAHIERLYLDVRRHGKRAGDCRTAGITCAGHGCGPDRHAGLAPKTMRHVHGALRAVLEDAVDRGLLARNPADARLARAALPPRRRGGQRVDAGQHWDDAQARQFLDATRDHRLYALWATLLGTGMRRSEACGLSWNDVDLDTGVVHVRETVTSVRGHAVSSDNTKSDAGRRTILAGPELVTILRRHRARQNQERLAAGSAWVDTGAVFAEPDGTGLHPGRLSNRFSTLTDKLGLPRIGVHGLRHTHATSLLRDRVPITVVSQRLGHADPSITLSTYSHAMPSDDALAAQSIGRILFG
jgi:integrase